MSSNLSQTVNGHNRHWLSPQLPFLPALPRHSTRVHLISITLRYCSFGCMRFCALNVARTLGFRHDVIRPSRSVRQDLPMSARAAVPHAKLRPSILPPGLHLRRGKKKRTAEFPDAALACNAATAMAQAGVSVFRLFRDWVSLSPWQYCHRGQGRSARSLGCYSRDASDGARGSRIASSPNYGVLSEMGAANKSHPPPTASEMRARQPIGGPCARHCGDRGHE